MSLLSLTLLTLTGCSDSAMSGSGYGLTPGGQQGLDNARNQVENGQVPSPDDITVEGLLNEHDMPLEGAPCDEVVCMGLAGGVGRIDSLDADSVLVQIGFDTNIDADTWVRPPTEFTVVIDVSGSMDEEIAPIRVALLAMADQLTSADTLAIITYGSTTQVVLGPVSGADRSAITNAIEDLRSGGSTNMEAGLELGYEVAIDAATGRNARVVLFTDEQPNTGATDPGSFKAIIQNGADHGIGLTMLGIGDSFGSGLAYEIGDLRGGNWKYLAAGDDIEAVFTDDFGFLVTPIAYDLEFELSTTSPLEAAYNVQGARDDGTISALVTTLFLSEGHGASILQLETAGRDPDDTRVAWGSVTFETTDARIVTQELEGDIGQLAGGYDGDAFAEVGTRKAAVLINEALTAIELCQAYQAGRPESVRDMVAETEARLRSEATALQDPALQEEVAFFAELRANAGL